MNVFHFLSWVQVLSLGTIFWGKSPWNWGCFWEYAQSLLEMTLRREPIKKILNTKVAKELPGPMMWYSCLLCYTLLTLWVAYLMVVTPPLCQRNLVSFGLQLAQPQKMNHDWTKSIITILLPFTNVWFRGLASGIRSQLGDSRKTYQLAAGDSPYPSCFGTFHGQLWYLELLQLSYNHKVKRLTEIHSQVELLDHWSTDPILKVPTPRLLVKQD